MKIPSIHNIPDTCHDFINNHKANPKCKLSTIKGKYPITAHIFKHFFLANTNKTNSYHF